jgi:hypothetical protein
MIDGSWAEQNSIDRWFGLQIGGIGGDHGEHAE